MQPSHVQILCMLWVKQVNSWPVGSRAEDCGQEDNVLLETNSSASPNFPKTESRIWCCWIHRCWLCWKCGHQKIDERLFFLVQPESNDVVQSTAVSCCSLDYGIGVYCFRARHTGSFMVTLNSCWSRVRKQANQHQSRQSKCYQNCEESRLSQEDETYWY